MKLTKMSTRYLLVVLPQVFGIANAFGPPVWFSFYRDTGCRSQIDNGSLQLGDAGQPSSECGLIQDDGMHKVRGLSIWNPNPCVVGVYGDSYCSGNMIAYAMHWNGEPSCFNLSGSTESYYATISCLAPTQSTT
jgi:hypothetical protein